MAWFLAGATLLFLAVWLAPAHLTSAGLASYVPLHTFMETFAIVVSILIFGVAWNAYSGERPGNVLILACGFLAVGLIDFAHVISFPGMPDFVTPAGLEKAINFWLAARLLAAATLLLVALRQWQPVPTLAARTLLLAASVALTGLIYWVGLYHADLLPRTFAPGKGLTPFKIAAEYFIIAVLVAAAWFFLRQVKRRGSFSALCLFAACMVSGLSELCFTLFSDVADLFNLLGHVYKVAAYALIYRAVFVASVRDPFARLSRARQELEQADAELRRVNAGLEKRVAERTQQLEQSSRAKSDFLANMSHELRTPLNAIIGFSEMLKDGLLGELNAKQRGFVTDIFDAGAHLLSLINDILDLSKVEAGMLKLEPGALDAAVLLKSSLQMVREKAAARRIGLDTQFDSSLGNLLADERKLKQIVYNLLGNAVKFTPEGGTVTLSARRCKRAEVALDAAMPGRLIALPPGEAGEFLAIAVQDSGMGIAEEHLSKLFEPFTQVDSSVARRYAGTGLGLSLVRRLAELHGGTVGVASRLGSGSRFCVWLPYREAATHEGGTVSTVAARSTPAISAPAAGQARDPAAPAMPLALVIEDDDRIADLIMAQLRAQLFEVIRAATAEEGLVLAAKSRPQLITLDVILPAMDGWEFMRRLRSDPKLADTPVVIISGSADLDRGIALGARRLLQKPFVRKDLTAALAGLVDARSDGEMAQVLVVDDNVQAVELLATAIEAAGYRVLRAYGGAEAIEVARRGRPDLVILDLMMPEVSGFEVARALRESEHTADIPILVLTAKDLTAADRARLKGGVSAILAKASFKPSELIVEVRRALPAHTGV